MIAQGGEGGGHTGSVPTSILLPQVVDAVDIPVIGAGGFFDGRGLVAALAYGAAGIAMGTRFLLTSGEPGARRGEAASTSTRTVDRHRRHHACSTACRSGCCAPSWWTSSMRRRLAVPAGRSVAARGRVQKMSGTSWPDWSARASR